MSLAKITRPKLHKVVPRTRLFRRLDDAGRPLAWIVGPPGAGKSALVASWMEARHLGGAWYQVDPADRDLATIFDYLGRAVPAGQRRRSRALPVFTPEHHADPAGFARVFFRALFERLKPPAALVFDNYHALPPDAPFHALVEVMVGELPEGVLVVATSRSDPPPQCAALRANDRIAILDWEDLRLTFEETRAIATLRKPLEEAQLRALHARSDGWPVGLVLSLEQAAGASDNTDHGIGPGTRDVLFAYFAAQILDTLPEATRTRLARIALLPRATAAQAREIARDEHADALLDGLYRKRLFVERRGHAYQFHDLFRAFLLAELECTQPVDVVAAARRDAADLLARAEQPEAAFECVAVAGDWPSAAALVLRFAPYLLEHGRLATLRAWIEALPEAMVAASAWLLLWRGVAMAPFDPLQARDVFATAYERFGEDDPMGRILSSAAVLATHYLEFDHGVVDRWVDALLPLLEASPVFPAQAAELRVQGALLFALGYQRPRLDLVGACVARMEALLASPGIPVNPRVHGATLLLAHHQVAADFDAAARIVALASPWLVDPALTPNHRALWTLQCAHLHAKQGRDVEATRAYADAEALCDANALVLPQLRVVLHHGRAMLALCAGDPARAEEERAGAAARWTFARKLDRALDAGLRAWIATHRDEHAEALACARSQCGQMDAFGPVWLRCMARLQLAIAEQDHAGATADVSPWLREARALLGGTCLDRLAPAIDAVEAWVRLRRVGGSAARAWIEGSVAGRGTHEGQWVLRLHPRVLPELYAAALALDIAPGDVRRAIAAYGLRAPEVDPPGWPWPFEVRTLGRFEVLRDGRPLAFSRKVPKKTLALLKAVVALGGRSVSEHRLLDALWPGEEGDAAARALDATVLRLRSLLGDPAAIVQRGGRVALDPHRVWVDVFAFEHALACADAAAHRRDVEGETGPLRRALELHGGPFLAEDEGEPWPVATRERLRGRFMHAVSRLARSLEAAGDDEAAIGAYLRGIDADPAVESFYQGLMRCYARTGRRGEAIAAFQRLRQILGITLGLAPSRASERLFESLMQASVAEK